ncbi:hypothetical protein ABLE92_15185 [Gordonia sp. VNQ95]|uniref:hypothetical protein n=1 Tax=Gordonia sp. VNQ95 TaxID=3156619 RepID=UPI0032B4ED33
MKNLRYAVMSIAAVVATALVVPVATAHAAPAVAATQAATAPTYRAELAPDGSSVAVRLADATFAPTPVDGTLSIRDESGVVRETVALQTELNGVVVPLRPAVSADGSTVTLTPELTSVMRDTIARGMHPVSAKKDKAFATMMAHLNNGWNRGNAGVTTAVGALIGFAVGFFIIGGWIVGTAIGAAIGAAVGINAGDPKAGQAVLDWINTP